MRIFSAGSNTFGQLSQGSKTDSHTFRSVIFSKPLSDPTSKVVKIVCGANHTLVLFTSGELWGCGANNRGQLALLGGNQTSFDPNLETLCLDKMTLPADLSGQGWLPTDVAAGWETSFVVLRRAESDDLLLSFGSDDYQMLGAGTAVSDCVRMVAPRQFLRYPNHTHESVRIVDIQSALYHAAAILSIGEERVVVGWGASRHDQLGSLDRVFSSPPRVLDLEGLSAPSAPVSVAVGRRHTMILHENGLVSALGIDAKRGWVGDESGKYGYFKSIGTTWNKGYGVAVPNWRDTKWMMLSAGFGSRHTEPSETEVVIKEERRKLTQLATGSEHCLVLFGSENGGKETDSMWGWGWNEHGNLGEYDGTAALSSSREMVTLSRIKTDGVTENGERRIESVWAGCATSWIVTS